jgi:hypothetical protein
MSNNNAESHAVSNQGELQRQFSLPSFLVNAVGPDLTIPGQHNVQSKSNYQGQIQDTQPALFDQNQVKNNFAPVYAIPPFPSHHPHGQGIGGYQGMQQDTHPALFGQSQFTSGFGPVYAVPSFPSNLAQGAGEGQWKQWGSYHQTIPYCWFQRYFMNPTFRR